MGTERVGVIAARGAAVTGYEVGQRVVAGAITPCGQCEMCLDGQTSQCGGKAVGGWKLGNTIDGCQAEYVRIPDATANLALVPAELSDEQVLMCPHLMSTDFAEGESGVRGRIAGRGPLPGEGRLVGGSVGDTGACLSQAGSLVYAQKMALVRRTGGQAVCW